MKIGFVIGTLNYSGAEKIARYLIEALHYEYKHEIGIILISGEGPYPELDYAKQFPLTITGNKFSRTYKRQREIRKIVSNEKFDIVISFGVKFNLDVMEALKHTCVKVILCERNDPVNDPSRRILRIRRTLCYPYASGYVFQTKRIASFFGKKIMQKGIIIPNFIEKPLEMLYRDDSPHNIVTTARLDDRQKNISMLLRAFAEFSKDNDYHLFVVGEGPDKDLYQKYIEENRLQNKIYLTGKQNVYDYLRKAQIYVLPSNYEGMPNALIEAMASGIPSIATDCSGGGAKELIQNHINGTLIPINGEFELVEALRELAFDQELRKQYSVEAYKLNADLQFDKIIRKWIEYIEKVALE